MPIVFVHGVNTRNGPAYDAGVKVTKGYLKDCFGGTRIGGRPLAAIKDIAFPYWGDLGTTFAWQMASLPRGEMEALGTIAEADLRALLAHVRDALPGGITNEPLTALAKHNFQNAAEIVAMMALDHTPPGKEADVAQFVRSIQTYAAANPAPAWLANTTNDVQFLGNLRLAARQQGGVEAQGLDDVFNFLSGVAANLKYAAMNLIGSAVDKVGDFASTKLLGWTREGLNANLGRFFGDVFIYFNSRGNRESPGPIPKLLLDAIDTAVANATPGDPLVIVGHSLGGVIMYDLATHFRPELPVDLFVTVGSQVAHFEEMKLFRSSDPAVKAPSKAKVPANINRWINVYDEVDIFAYAAKPIFDRVDVDGRYDTQTYVIKAHGAYFDQARFYERLRVRVDQLP
jgi:hypothetical protein